MGSPAPSSAATARPGADARSGVAGQQDPLPVGADHPGDMQARALGRLRSWGETAGQRANQLCGGVLNCFIVERRVGEATQESMLEARPEQQSGGGPRGGVGTYSAQILFGRNVIGHSFADTVRAGG